MSLSTWKAEFYHRKPAKTMTALEAADHSLLKWEGLLPKNLKKHKVINDGDVTLYCAEEDVHFSFDSDNCGLCVKYMIKDHTAKWEGRCKNCVLVKAGEASCMADDSPFGVAMERGRVEPMIDSLRNTVVWILENDVK